MLKNCILGKCTRCNFCEHTIYENTEEHSHLVNYSFVANAGIQFSEARVAFATIMVALSGGLYTMKAAVANTCSLFTRDSIFVW